MKQYRNEWKYTLDEADIAVILPRLEAAMEKDGHGDEDGRYAVHSVYFDDYTDRCARENEAGISERFKYRIRYYGNDLQTLRLERKEKTQGRCHKETARITAGQYEKLMHADAGDLFFETEDPLVRRFCAHIMTAHFTPKVIIDYERTAFIEPLTNVRITIDKNISASYDFEHFLDGDFMRFPLQKADVHVLEVKFDEILPGYLKNIVTKREFIHSAFSKYYLGRRILQKVTR